MGWSRYAHSMRLFVLNSGFFYIRSTRNTIQLMDRITARLMPEKLWDQAVFNEEIFFPSHDDYNSSLITVGNEFSINKTNSQLNNRTAFDLEIPEGARFHVVVHNVGKNTS